MYPRLPQPVHFEDTTRQGRGDPKRFGPFSYRKHLTTALRVTQYLTVLEPMPFVKLDTGILNSTLWLERECREVFITALLMAVPVEIKEATPTIKIRTTEPDSFAVPPGWYGFVEAAAPGIIHRALVDRDLGLLALEKLATPDGESRSPEFEGRRMVRVAGGYLILNYMKYRDKDHTAADRMRRYRDRKAGRLDPVTRDGDAIHRNVTQAEAESRSIEEKEKPTTTRSRETRPTFASFFFEGQRLKITVPEHKALATAFEGADFLTEYRKMDAWLVTNKRSYRSFGRFANSWLSRQAMPKTGGQNGKTESFEERRRREGARAIQRVLGSHAPVHGDIPRALPSADE